MSPRERVRRVRTGVVDRGVPAETVPAGEPIGPVGGRVYPPKAVLAWGQVTVGVEEEGRCSRRDGTDLRLGGRGHSEWTDGLGACEEVCVPAPPRHAQVEGQGGW